MLQYRLWVSQAEFLGPGSGSLLRSSKKGALALAPFNMFLYDAKSMVLATSEMQFNESIFEIPGTGLNYCGLFILR